MQEHVELEVSLEIIMAKIAEKIFEISNENDDCKKNILAKELKKLIDMQESAYKGNKEIVKKILSM